MVGGRRGNRSLTATGLGSPRPQGHCGIRCMWLDQFWLLPLARYVLDDNLGKYLRRNNRARIGLQQNDG